MKLEKVNHLPINYYNVFQNVPILMVTVNLEGTIVDANAYFEKVIGYPREEIIGQSFFFFHTPESGKKGQQAMWQRIQNGTIPDNIFTLVTKDGQEVEIILATSIEHPGNDGTIKYFTGIFEDITTPKQLETRHKKHDKQQEILIEYSRKLMLPELSFQDICDMTAEFAQHLSGAKFAAANYIHPQTKTIVYDAVFPKSFFENITFDVYDALKPDKNGYYPTLGGHALNTKKGFYTNAPEQHPAFDPDAPEGQAKISNFLSVPAMVGDLFLGQIFFADSPTDFTDDDLALAERMGAYFGLAIMRRQAEEAEQWESTVNHALADLAAALLSPQNSLYDISTVTLHHCLEVTSAEHGYVGYIDTDTKDLVCTTLTEMLSDGSCKIQSPEQKIAFPIGDDGRYPHLWGHSLNTREGFYTNVPQEHSTFGNVTPKGHISFTNFLSVPALIGDQLVGQITLANCQDGFNNRHFQAAARLANLFALAIQRQTAAKTLQQSQDNFRQVFDVLPIAYQSLDVDGYILDVNQLWLEILGYHRDEVIGKWFGNFLDEEGRILFPQRFENYKKVGRVSNAQFQMITKGENCIHVEFEGRVSYDLDGNFERSHCLFQDITERKRAESSLRESEQSYRTLAQNIPGLVFRAEAKKNFNMLFLSQNTTNLTGYTENELNTSNGWQMDKYIHLDDLSSVKSIVRTAIKNKQAYITEYRFKHKDGSTRYFQERGKPIFDENGDILYIDGVIFDITETKAYEREIKTLNEELEARVQARTSELEEANKELEAFSYSVSHDLRAPLRAIKGFSDILVEENADILSAESMEILGRIRASSDKMNHLIEDLLSLSRLDRHTPHFQELHLELIASQVYESLTEKIKERPINFTNHPMLKVQGDPILIEMLLRNLISNAIKFSWHKDPAEVIFDSYTENGETVYFVRDNGIGFKMEYYQKLFTPFQRLNSDEDYPGTGVGLAIVRRIINHHNGRIWAESTPGEGAVFFFTLNGEADS